ncbi:hypothetical protein ACIBF1_40680 [Spirillospora sp. NPDC050679]
MNEAAAGEELHRRGWREPFTLAEMTGKWERLVAMVEDGYEGMVDEYANDLYCRNWLHEAWLLLDEHLLVIWSPRVKELDDRFRTATVDDDGQAVGYYHRADPDLWWWRRHPRLLVGDLGEALRSAGAAG